MTVVEDIEINMLSYQSSIEKLENETIFLKAENAHLKKLRALVKERITRESGK